MNEYKENSNFCGHNEATDEERKIITNYLSRDKLKYVNLRLFKILFV